MHIKTTTIYFNYFETIVRI